MSLSSSNIGSRLNRSINRASHELSIPRSKLSIIHLYRHIYTAIALSYPVLSRAYRLFPSNSIKTSFTVLPSRSFSSDHSVRGYQTIHTRIRKSKLGYSNFYGISASDFSRKYSTTRSNMASYDYDLIVIGGGSGGMSSAKEASANGAKVALFDFVKPSTQGTTWGLGGTCVNVGCVPKKIMHYASLLGHSVSDAESLGWDVKTGKHNWEKLVEAVTNHVHMLNFRYRAALKKKEVNYINALAKFEDRHTVSYTTKGKNAETKRVTAANIIIAVGGRPHVPSEIPGAKEYAITSDDIFFLDRSPGKTLCVGGSYIALECAGFLTELGYDVTVAVRSILLRGFDRQCAKKIGDTMTDLGTKFLYSYVVQSISKNTDGRLLVVLLHEDGSTSQDVFDTVFFAAGREPDLQGLNLDSAGVVIEPASKKIPVVNERTNIPNIFAIGDVVQGKQELTPVAVRAGELLARRLFAGSSKQMDYDLVATSVFTPIEYGSVGISEEEAIARYGIDDVEVYLSEFTTLEISAVHRQKPGSKHDAEGADMGHNCLSKLVTVKSLGEKVVGFHFCGPNAGEITQGFALALKLGATKSDFDELVGIHPTDAESFCALSITKRSGIDYAAGGGCGGGVCG